MSLSAFNDANVRPTNEDLLRELGAAGAPWNSLIAHCESYGLVQQWNHSGAKFGWSLRMKKASRIVLYLTPRAGHFLLGLVLSTRGVVEAQAAGLPEEVLAAIAAARTYAEGTGFRITVTSAADLPAISALLAIKMATMSK